MKLVTFAQNGQMRLGALQPNTQDQQIVDLNRADSHLPDNMLAFLEAGQPAKALAQQALAAPPAAAIVARSAVTLKAPIPRPGKIICIGLNYRDHAIESGLAIPTYPVVFAKYSNVVIGPGEAIVLPKISQEVDYEAEFGVVIGRRGRSISEAEALNYVAGYLPFHDVSARDYQMRTSQWVIGKTFDTFGPMGPALVTADEIPDPHNLNIQLSIGGEVLQSSNIRHLIFPVEQLIYHLSAIMTLEPGDVIATGTPAGVGTSRTPKRYLKAGDVVRIEIERLGVLENPVAAEADMTPPDTAQMLQLYRTMLVIRRTEEQLAKSHQAGLIPGACHTYIGEEAVATGVCAHLTHEDVVFSTHRGHGHALAKGVTPRELIAELFGRATGVSRGRGGSMHLFSPEVGLLGTTGIVGPNILQAAGAGYTFKLLKTGRVSVAFFGDGAVSNGAFHEGVNLATVWDLPVIFVCENNMYATEVPFSKATRNPQVANRGTAYGINSCAVDGNDVLAVYAAAQTAVERARAGGGPTLIEARTYRTRSHAEGMRDVGYRTRDEVDDWKTRDPIQGLKDKLLAGGAPAADLEKIEAEVLAQAEEAADFAKNSPWPDPATATRYIFSETKGQPHA